MIPIILLVLLLTVHAILRKHEEVLSVEISPSKGSSAMIREGAHGFNSTQIHTEAELDNRADVSASSLSSLTAPGWTETDWRSFLQTPIGVLAWSVVFNQARQVMYHIFTQCDKDRDGMLSTESEFTPELLVQLYEKVRQETLLQSDAESLVTKNQNYDNQMGFEQLWAAGGFPSHHIVSLHFNDLNDVTKHQSQVTEANLGAVMKERVDDGQKKGNDWMKRMFKTAETVKKGQFNPDEFVAMLFGIAPTRYDSIPGGYENEIAHKDTRIKSLNKDVERLKSKLRELEEKESQSRRRIDELQLENIRLLTRAT